MSTPSFRTAHFMLDLILPVSPDRAWRALTIECGKWWPADFVTSPKTQRFVIEPVLGGRAYEDYGNQDGLTWYTVIGLEAGRELIMAGHMLPPFGGPANTALRLTLAPHPQGTLFLLRDDRWGALGPESPIEGWRTVFERGLKSYLESKL
jgi:hypothetical protein